MRATSALTEAVCSCHRATILNREREKAFHQVCKIIPQCLCCHCLKSLIEENALRERLGGILGSSEEKHRQCVRQLCIFSVLVLVGPASLNQQFARQKHQGQIFQGPNLLGPNMPSPNFPRAQFVAKNISEAQTTGEKRLPACPEYGMIGQRFSHEMHASATYPCPSAPSWLCHHIHNKLQPHHQGNEQEGLVLSKRSALKCKMVPLPVSH